MGKTGSILCVSGTGGRVRQMSHRMVSGVKMSGTKLCNHSNSRIQRSELPAALFVPFEQYWSGTSPLSQFLVFNDDFQSMTNDLVNCFSHFLIYLRYLLWSKATSSVSSLISILSCRFRRWDHSAFASAVRQSSSVSGILMTRRGSW